MIDDDKSFVKSFVLTVVREKKKTKQLKIKEKKKKKQNK
jgi:hypothetical protein